MGDEGGSLGQAGPGWTVRATGFFCLIVKSLYSTLLYITMSVNLLLYGGDLLVMMFFAGAVPSTS